jgi:thiosulfate dehydrogenase
MGKFIIGIIIGILLVPAAFYVYCRSGSAPVATAATPMPLERYFARTALHATIRRDAPKTHSTKASEGELLAGVKVYQDNCAVCHGLPGKPATDIAKGLDDPVGVTYWKAKHGIRLTGMPGFVGLLTDEQIWNVSLLLANADKVPASVTQALTAAPKMASSKEQGSAAGHSKGASK